MIKKILSAVVVVMVVFIVGVVIFYFAMVKPMLNEISQIQQMEIATINLNDVADGSYRGDFTYGKFTYEVEVTVKDHKIESIKVIKNRKSKYAKMAEGILARIVEKQTLQVDAVSGATTTSKAFMKAVENALAKGIQQ